MTARRFLFARQLVFKTRLAQRQEELYYKNMDRAAFLNIHTLSPSPANATLQDEYIANNGNGRL